MTERRTLVSSVVLLVVGLVLAHACSGCVGPDPQFVRASRLYYDWSAPIVIRAVEEDPLLSDEQKARRLGLVVARRVAIESAEREVSE